jgi:hypothetical protein
MSGVTVIIGKFDVYFPGLGRVGESLAESKINSFADLQPGWDYGSGDAPSENTRNLAIQWSRRLVFLGLSKTNAMPGSEGQISVSGSLANHYIEIIINPDGTVSLDYDIDRKQESYIPNMSTIEAITKLREIMGQAWNALTIFTQGNTIQRTISGADSRLPTIADRYQLLSADAQITIVVNLRPCR